MKRSFLIVVLVCLIHFVNAQNYLNGKIKIYFTKSVDTTVSTGVYAQQLYKAIDDTLVAYINRTKHDLDIAIYNYTYASTISDIAGAINAAYNRGVKVRMIYDGSVSNTGLKNILPAIPQVASPQGSNYNIMHNKFVIIDSKTNNTNDAIVWTGSTNWSSNMFYLDDNNVVILQDQPLALAYRTEFEEMWGDTGLIPNPAKARFGKYKTDNTPHQFTIDGKQVELYFSPSDHVNSQVIKTITTANSDFEFCLLQFSRNDIADSVVSMKTKNPDLISMGIEDPSGLLVGKPAYDTMKTVMGSNLLTENQPNSLLHHKYLIVDQSNPLSDPLVLTGSHNWTTTADTKNDENTLVIHDPTIANIYYQEFIARFKENGGVLGVNDVKEENNFTIYPNPANGNVTIKATGEFSKQMHLEFYDMMGKLFFSRLMSGQEEIINASLYNKGIYFVKIVSGSGSIVKKLVLN